MSRFGIARFIYRLSMLNLLLRFGSYFVFFPEGETEYEQYLELLVVYFVTTTAMGIARASYLNYKQIQDVYPGMTVNLAWLIVLYVSIFFQGGLCLLLEIYYMQIWIVPSTLTHCMILFNMGGSYSMIGYHLSKMERGIKL